ncbi:hypothetical protein ACOSP7_023156 [Xanthoceras sorbifolium]|uniref:Uncharacterized protein n=1 Tax=Xanthoceras sorbifolium TaxID=99658 RepID=A0ABQ8HQG5_9ROSI|nr:hypothetical protein JRO89_XS08G0196000 [Xanthoceras sorbifolium]
MAFSTLKFLTFGLMILVSSSLDVHGQVVVDHETSLKLMTDAMEWPLSMSTYDGSFDEDYEEEDMRGSSSSSEDDEESEYSGRRSLFWHGVRYYISYGALSANRIPCPPRSGRSYYTHNCYKARGPVQPYTRGCSAITRCRR